MKRLGIGKWCAIVLRFVFFFFCTYLFLGILVGQMESPLLSMGALVLALLAGWYSAHGQWRRFMAKVSSAPGQPKNE